MTKKLRIGQIPYLNSVLFYHLLAGRDDVSLEPLVPRQLSGAVVEDAVDAGPVPLVTCWDIQSRYEPLDDFAIATIAKTRSIFLYSKRPFDELEGATIGVTGETSTSVRLLNVLLKNVYRVQPSRLTHVDWPSNDAFLLIGDEAILHRHGVKDYEYMVDLGEVWNDWTGLPFVFARWMVRRDLEESSRQNLVASLAESLESGWRQFDEVVTAKAHMLNLTITEAREYLEGFHFRMGEKEHQAVERFRQFDSAIHDTSAGART